MNGTNSERRSQVLLGLSRVVRDEAEGKLFGKEDLPCFAKQMNGLGNTLLIFGKHAPDFGLLFCIWNRQNMHKKLRASTCLPDTCPLYS